MKNPSPPSPRPVKASWFSALCCMWMCALGGLAVAQAQTDSPISQSSITQAWQPSQLSQIAVQGDPHEEIRKLLRQAKYSEAMTRVDQGLAKNPRDPQMRFWRGFLFEQLGQSSQALPIYLALTQDYPELAEPHNNLAVLYAARGDYLRAKESLEQALRSNPAYAVAHENMGDVLLRLARQHYEQALTLAPTQRTAAHKIERLAPVLEQPQKTP